MYKFTIKHRDESGTNQFNPDKVTQGYTFDINDGSITSNSSLAIGTEYIYVSSSQVYQLRRDVTTAGSVIVYYDINKNYHSSSYVSAGNTPTFTIPSGSYYCRISIHSIVNGQDPTLISITLGSGTLYEAYFTFKEIHPTYSKASRGIELEYQHYRDKLNGSFSVIAEEYDYLNALDFETQIFLLIEDLDNILSDYNGFFFKTDCKWDDDNKKVELKITTTDEYYDILGGIDKTFNIIELAPALEEVTIRKRPVIQVYVAGDTVITNIVGGSSWEQDIIIDPEFDDTTLTDTYKFNNSKTITFIASGYSTLLSTDVTGEYINNINTNNLYKLEFQIYTPGIVNVYKRYFIRRVSDSFTLYETDRFLASTSINVMEFHGVNGETGDFFFTEYNIYSRYITGLDEVSGDETFPIPTDDIVPSNPNYTRVFTFGVSDFYTSEEVVDYPTKFGRLPSSTPDEGKYYKELVTIGDPDLWTPLPVSKSNWKAASLWFFSSFFVKSTEFINGEDIVVRDTYHLHSTIQTLLDAIGSDLIFENTTDYSDILYNATNPLGDFTFLDFNGGAIGSDTVGNIHQFITQKSNIITSNYENPAQKAEISLGQVLDMLRDTQQLYWHIEDGKLRIEHISYYNNGGSYTSTEIGTDLTGLINPRNNKTWGFALNKWEFDKETMPERFEFGWMDDVSSSFEGYDIEINSKFVQKGLIEDRKLGNFTTDIDYIHASPQEVSRDGFVLLGMALVDSVYRSPYLDVDLGNNKEIIMQNGFMSWIYLHDKYHKNNLPADNVNINGEDEVLTNNITRKKVQEVVFPAQSIDPYKLITTDLGNGKIDKVSIDMSSLIIKGTIKHDTE